MKKFNSMMALCAVACLTLSTAAFAEKPMSDNGMSNATQSMDNTSSMTTMPENKGMQDNGTPKKRTHRHTMHRKNQPEMMGNNMGSSNAGMNRDGAMNNNANMDNNNSSDKGAGSSSMMNRSGMDSNMPNNNR